MSNFTKEWFLDSRATDHISPYSEDFDELNPVLETNNFITIPDGSRARVTHNGKVVLNNKITMSNVLLVPAFHYRLLSVHKLCAYMNSNIIFSAKHCHLQDLFQKQPALLLGEIQSGLYTVKPQVIQHNGIFKSSTACLSISDDSKLRHLRMGHIPFPQLKLLRPSCTVKDEVVDSICQICPKAKQTRCSFHVSSIKTSSILEILHVDVWGPYTVKNYNHCNHLLP